MMLMAFVKPRLAQPTLTVKSQSNAHGMVDVNPWPVEMLLLTQMIQPVVVLKMVPMHAQDLTSAHLKSAWLALLPLEPQLQSANLKTILGSAPLLVPNLALIPVVNASKLLALMEAALFTNRLVIQTQANVT